MIIQSKCNAAVVLAATLIGIVANGAQVTPAQADALVPPVLGHVKLLGVPGARADACIRARAYSDWARGDMYEEAVNAFRTHWDDEGTRSGWQNEYWGKTMLCFAGAIAYTGDPGLRDWAVEKTHAFLRECQRPNGYLSTYAKEDFLRKNPENPDANRHWCFNIWGRKYTMWALVDLARATGDATCRAAAEKMLDHLIAQLRRLGLTIDKTGSWHGISSMSILRPVVELYRDTGKKEYLDFAKEIVRGLDAEPAGPGTIMRNAFRKDKIKDWYPNPTFWAKAYETMSCLEGMVDYYRVTGDRRVLDAVKAFHRHLVDEELNPMCSAGFFDHFLDARHRVNGMTELCDVTHWIRLNRELFLLTGETKYADYVEEAFYNAFLAGVQPDGRWGAHIIRSHGTRHLSAPHQTGMLEHQCCPDNMMRTYFDWAGTTAAMSADGALHVVLYSDADVALPGASLTILGGYPYSECPIDVVVRRDAPGKVRFRVPYWSRTLTVNGKPVTFANGWYEVSAPKGASSWRLGLDMSPHIVKSEARPEFIPPSPVFDHGGDINKYTVHFMEWYTPDMAGLARAVPALQVFRGPLALAKGRLAGTSRAETLFASTLADCDWKVSLKPLPATSDTAGLPALWRLTFKRGVEEHEMQVSDFASVSCINDPSNWFSLWF